MPVIHCHQKSLMGFENQALNAFGPRLDEVTGDCTKLRKEMFHNLFFFLIFGQNH
jgi:hypothetical protein